MRTVLPFNDKLCKFINQFRLRWGVSHFSLNTTTKQAELNPEANLVTSVFELRSKLQAGWYMLEVQMKLPTVQIKADVHLDGKFDDDSVVVGFPLYSGRKCKRLVHLRVSGELHLAVQLEPEDFEVQHLHLGRVSERFARSRMLRKLQALHPHYKIRRGISQYRAKQSRLTYTDDLPTLWADYCALFEGGAEIVPYSGWIRVFDTPSDKNRGQLRFLIEQFQHKPLVSVVMPVYNPNPAWLVAVIESVRTQVYANWELCIADDASTDPAIRQLLEHYAQLDQRIKVVFREFNGHISVSSNSALALVQGEWIALLDHDDVLAEHALFWVVDAINQNPGTRLIYSDEDKLDEVGTRSDAYFKCDWNPDLFYSQNMISHLGVYHAVLVREVDGFRAGLEGSQDYDLALRCIEKLDPNQIYHIPRVLYHWRIHAGSTAHDIASKSYAMIAGERALNEHFERLGVNAKAEMVGIGYRVRYVMPDILPLVSLIILTRNGFKLLRQCINSILTKTTYSNYEILIVDNGSNEPATLRYLNKLISDPRIRVMRDDGPFNYSALNNAAVKLARGEIVGLINNDIEVISPDWLSEMVSHALRPEVGAVGARLWYSDNTIQHAGIILGMEGFAGHGHRYLPKGDVGYCGRAALIQSLSAVTGACLLVRRSIYEAVGGLNEIELQVACNDVDFCLRLREAGYRNIWTPYAELYHHESATRGFDDTPEKQARAAQEAAYMHQRWGELLQNDPAYSPNLSLDNEGFTLAWPPRVAAIASVTQDEI